MTIEQHKMQVNEEYIEQTFKILLSLHKVSRKINVVYDPTFYTTSTSLLDPNMFPLHSS